MRLPLARLERVLEPRRPRRLDVRRQQWLAEHVDAILAAGHPLVRPGCLTRGVTLYYFMRRAGVDVGLQFGMGKPVREIEGHCWLVRGSEPYLERRDPRPIFAPTYRIPSAQ
jgi:hypothetical protein